MRIIRPAYRLIAAFIAGLMLISTIGLAVEIHRCNGEIESIGVYKMANSCSMSNASGDCETDLNSCELEQSVSHNCCTNESFYDVMDCESETASGVEIQLTQFVVYFYNSPNDFIINEGQHQFPEVKIPLLTPDRSVLYSRFII